MINKAKARQSLNTIDDTVFARFFDEFLQTDQTFYKYPFRRKKIKVRVFDGVYFYAVPIDYEDLAFLDNDEDHYEQRARFRFETFSEFLQNKDYRNRWGEIWDNGVPYLGIRYDGGSRALTSRLLNQAETATEWTASGTATSPVLDNVIYDEGDGAIKFTVTAGTATMKNTLPNATTVANYKRNYHFKKIYLDSVPTSITLRIHVNASNYVETTGITTQFDGSPLVAGQFNLISHDLNEGTVTGTVSDDPTFTYEEFDLVGASAGTYYVDASYLRQWQQIDLWYYSKNACVTSGGVEQEQFYDTSSDTYDLETALIGPPEWVYVVIYGGSILALRDKQENQEAEALENSQFAKAIEALKKRYPTTKAIPTDQMWRFKTHSGAPDNTLYKGAYVIRRHR